MHVATLNFICSKLSARLALDRRRLEAAHLRYAVLKVVSYYPKELGTTTIYPDFKITLEFITPLFFSIFRSHYAGEYIAMSDNIPIKGVLPYFF